MGDATHSGVVCVGVCARARARIGVRTRIVLETRRSTKECRRRHDDWLVASPSPLRSTGLPWLFPMGSHSGRLASGRGREMTTGGGGRGGELAGSQPSCGSDVSRQRSAAIDIRVAEIKQAVRQLAVGGYGIGGRVAGSPRAERGPRCRDARMGLCCFVVRAGSRRRRCSRPFSAGKIVSSRKTGGGSDFVCCSLHMRMFM